MLELLDKLSNTINKYKLDFNDINISILSKNERVVYYSISIKYEDNIKTKKYKKYIVPYNRKVQINENSLKNLKFMKKEKMKQLDDDNISKSIENNVNNKLIKSTKLEKGNNDNCEYVNEKIEEIDLKSKYKMELNDKQNIDSEFIENNVKTEKGDQICKLNNSVNVDFDDHKNIVNNKKDISEIDNDEFINADTLINKEIDDCGCDNCMMMDNNVIYLSNKMKDLYLDILKNYDNILDNTYYINNNLEEAINVQNVKNKNIKIDLHNILQNKKKLNIDDIHAINNIINEDHDFPHITQLFRNKIVDPIMEELRFIKNEYNNFISIIN